MTAHPPNRWTRVLLGGTARGRKWTLSREQHLWTTVTTLQAVYSAPTRARVSTVLLQDRATCRYSSEKLSTAAIRQTDRQADRQVSETHCT